MARLDRETVSKGLKIDDGNDIISQLPDGVLLHILSFLSTMEAAATSVLSKRWQYLWTFVPVVDVHDIFVHNKDPEDYLLQNAARFINIVDRVLQQRNASSMKKFYLFCFVRTDPSRVDDWVSAAIRQNVEELDLAFSTDDPLFMLPYCVFDNRFIKVLKIAPRGTPTLVLPPRISLPCLNTLHLSGVTFPSDDLMHRLFCGCPSLEELAIVRCHWSNMKNITVAMPSLKTLVIRDPSFLSVRQLPGCVVKIDAINLITFEYEGVLTNEINVLSLSASAVPLIYILSPGTMHQEIGRRAFNLLRALRNVSSLRINIDFLLRVEDMLVSLPVFPNLILLELNEEPTNCSTKLLIKFLMILPKLEVLHLCGGLGWGEDDFTLELVPECISSSLKTVNYHGLKGTNGEMSFLKSLLQRATVLEKMNVFWSTERDQKYQEAQNVLLAVIRGSSRCELMITGMSQRTSLRTHED